MLQLVMVISMPSQESRDQELPTDCMTRPPNLAAIAACSKHWHALPEMPAFGRKNVGTEQTIRN